MAHSHLEDQIEIIGFFAKDNIKLCEKFTQGHMDVLRQHGFMHFKTYDNYWYQLKNSYAIIALIRGEAVGGIRLEMGRKNDLLPYEKVLSPLFPEVLNIRKDESLIKVAEPCSLWNSKKVSGKNLSIFLSRASIAMASEIQISNIVSFNATYTFRIPLDVGCTMIHELGEKGYFNYPTSQFRAALWLHSDLHKLQKADATAKSRMYSLRDKTQQLFIEEYDNQRLKIKYDLQI